MSSFQTRSIVLLALSPLLLCGPVAAHTPIRLEVPADALPGRYPNQLRTSDEELEFALLAPLPRTPRGAALFAVAHSSAGDVEVPALGRVHARDVDGDGTDDVVATFSVTALRAAGLLGTGSSRLSVDIRMGRETLLSGSDRVLSPDATIALIPAPTGRYAVGTTSDYWLDQSRNRVKKPGRPLFIRLWYPAVRSGAQPADYFLVAATARAVEESIPEPTDFLDLIHASSVRDARPAALARRPTLLLSTGGGLPLDAYAAIGEDLASHGFLVVGVGHPDGDSGPIAYPDGSVSEDVALSGLDALDSVQDPVEQQALADQIYTAANLACAQDLLFVLDCIEHLDRCTRSARMRDILARADLERVGALGHSFGGSAAIWADLLSGRIRASADLDGTIWGDPTLGGPDRPVLVLQSDDFTSDLEGTHLPRFLAHARSRTYIAHVSGANHDQFSDIAILTAELPDLADKLGFAYSPLDPTRVIHVQNAYVRAFFDQELDGHPSPLLAGPQPDFPEISLDVVAAPQP